MTQQKPAYLEVLATVKQNGRPYWTRIGAAFPTKDGAGFKLKLNYVPTDPATEIVVLPPKQAEAEE